MPDAAAWVAVAGLALSYFAAGMLYQRARWQEQLDRAEQRGADRALVREETWRLHGLVSHALGEPQFYDHEAEDALAPAESSDA